MAIDENKVLVPQTNEYKRAVQSRNIIIITSVLGFLVFLTFALIRLFNYIKEYLTIPDDLKA